MCGIHPAAGPGAPGVLANGAMPGDIPGPKSELPVGPAALLVLLAAAARAGRIRLGLLPPGRPCQCLVRVVADELVDSS